MSSKDKIVFAPQTIFDSDEDTGFFSKRRVSIASTTSEGTVPPLSQHQRRASIAVTPPDNSTFHPPPQRRMTLASWPVNSGMPLRWWENGKGEKSIHVAMDHVQFGL